MAAKEGGTDPDTNATLRTAIKNAKGQNMPKDNIEAAIKRADAKDAETFSEMDYEGKGPHGVLVVVECATDNPTRTVATVKSYFNKAGGSVVPNGSMDFMFNRKSVFEIDKTDAIDPEELEYMGFRDYLVEASLCLIEWPERGQGFLPTADIAIEIRQLGDGRCVTLCANSALGEQLIIQLGVG